jgi:hypothetical protein
MSMCIECGKDCKNKFCDECFERKFGKSGDDDK